MPEPRQELLLMHAVGHHVRHDPELRGDACPFPMGTTSGRRGVQEINGHAGLPEPVDSCLMPRDFDGRNSVRTPISCISIGRRWGLTSFALAPRNRLGATPVLVR